MKPRVMPATIAMAALMGTQVLAQGTPQTAGVMKVDPATVATGYRVSKVVGSTVVNEANETVGTIDDLIVTPSEQVPFAVLSVGGFLSMLAATCPTAATTSPPPANTMKTCALPRESSRYWEIPIRVTSMDNRPKP